VIATTAAVRRDAHALVVLRLIDLGGIEDALGRLRHGAGARTVVVLDPEPAGAPHALR
jgi:hypothetical protein